MRDGISGVAGFMDSIVIEMTSLGSAAITLFGAAFCLMQTGASRVSQSFAVFLVVIAVNNVPDAIRPVLALWPRSYTATAELITWPSSFFLAPLFWLYVVLLTSSADQKPARLAWHFALPGASVAMTFVVLASPAGFRETLYTAEPDLGSAWSRTLVLLTGLLQLAVFPQIAFYLILILRRLARFRLRLRDYYSSTERHELRWIYVLGGLGAAFWLGMALLLFGALGFEEVPPAISNLASLSGFALVAALTLWGLRQRPPLAPEPTDDPAPPAAQTSGKYEKSALSPEASERLSRKLRSAMEVDQLHRDANLSLWALARQIGASSNYISQTLNEVIGESFFDFVNSYRIAEAKTLLATTNASVLNITYEVGFNARSSFYNAFKRHTGQTPTSYRKNMSNRAGADDIASPLNDI